MKIPKDTEDRIDLYLLGGMSDQEAAAFEEEAKTNAELGKQLEQIRFEHEAMQMMSDDIFRAQLKDWKEEEDAQKKPIPIRSKQRTLFVRRLAMAASFLLLFGIGLRFWAGNNYNNQVFAEREIAAEFERDQSRSKTGEADQFYENVYQNINKSDYSSALSALQSVESPGIKTQWLTAAVLTKTGKHDEAISIYQNIIKTADQTTREETEWKLLLTYLDDDRTAEFEALRKKILDTKNHERAGSIKKLEKDLNSFWRLFSGS